MQYPVHSSGGADGSRRYQVPAVITATRVMSLLTAESEGVSLAELSRTLRLPKSSVRTVVLTLLGQGWLEYDEKAERYRLGQGFVVLARGAAARVDPIALARPHLEQIAEQTRLTCVLVRRLDDGYVIVDKVDSPDAVRVTADVGVPHHWRAGALARAFLAFVSDPELVGLGPGPGPGPPDGDGGIRDREGYRAAAERTRTAGYTVSQGEVYLGVNAVAAPVPAGSMPVFALAVIGTAGTLSPERADVIGRQLRDAALQLAALLA